MDIAVAHRQTSILTYSVYGLTLGSNLPIPGLLPGLASTPIDLTVTFGDSLDCSLVNCSVTDEIPYYVSPYVNERLQPAAIVRRKASKFHIIFCDGVEFLFDREDSTIRSAYPASLTLEYVATYFVGFVLGFVLRLRQCLCLHAAAVVINGRAVALLGAQGAGKSTTAAAFSKLGYSVLSDDITPLVQADDVFMVQPGYPRINLWPDSVQLLYGASDALPLITRDWDKRYLDLGLNGEKFSFASAPLAAIYVLGERSEGGPAPFAEQVFGPRAFLALVGNTYVNLLLDQEMRAYEFDAIGELLARVPVRRIASNGDFKHPNNLCDGIVRDLNSLPCAGFTRDVHVD
jgi:hypothetical protein